MKTVTGIICDPSASMRDNAEGHDITDEGGAWSRSVVHFIDDLIRNDDLFKCHFVFAIGIGESCRDSTLMSLRLLNSSKTVKIQQKANHITQSFRNYSIYLRLEELVIFGDGRQQELCCNQYPMMRLLYF